MTTPTGSPAWSRAASHAHYGGDVDKENYLSRGAIDARTDITAEQIQRLAADLEAVVRTCPMASLTYLNNDSTPAPPTIEAVTAMFGVRTTSYAGTDAPTGFPTASRTTDGEVVFTFASSYADPYSVSAAWAPVHALATVHGTDAQLATCTISDSTVTVRVFDDAGVVVQDSRVTLEVS